MKKILYPFLALTKAELEQLKGGNTEFVVTSINPGTDVVNENIVVGCICYFNNAGITKNTNTVSDCICSCMKKPI